jgi:hypothetical protein
LAPMTWKGSRIKAEKPRRAAIPRPHRRLKFRLGGGKQGFRYFRKVCAEAPSGEAEDGDSAGNCRSPCRIERLGPARPTVQQLLHRRGIPPTHGPNAVIVCSSRMNVAACVPAIYRLAVVWVTNQDGHSGRRRETS